LHPPCVLASHAGSLASKHAYLRPEPLVGHGRALLPGPLRPSGQCRLSLLVRAPAVPGAYELRVGLVQEQVAWFDDLNPADGVVATVQVGE
jgi:hypothetical protein